MLSLASDPVKTGRISTPTLFAFAYASRECGAQIIYANIYLDKPKHVCNLSLGEAGFEPTKIKINRFTACHL